MIEKVTAQDIAELVDNLDEHDLSKNMLCYFCVALGVSLEAALRDESDMDGGPESSDRKCPHCYDTEEEFGRLKLTKEGREYASFVMDEYEKYKKLRLGYK